jgi:hypothetical protein
VAVPVEVFRRIRIDVEIEPDEATQRGLLAIEKWLTHHIVERIPGGKRKSK